MNSPFDQLAVTLADPPPWWLPHLPLAQRLLDSRECIVDSLNAVRAESDCPVRFVDHSELPSGEAYESFIARTGRVPTRENLHDLLNGLMWLRFPCTKRRLNELQAAEIASRGVAGQRGPLRDALTLFDENAAILRAPDELVDALRLRDWTTLFVTHRSLWRSARVAIFGHALLEKLMQPRKAITAHVWRIAEDGDDVLASSLRTDALNARMFLPLPVLGVPDWWRDNESPAFYDDPEIFRARRR